MIYELSAKKALHDIDVRTRVLSAGADNIGIVVYANWYYETTETVRDEFLGVDEDGNEKWTYKDVTIPHSGTEHATGEHTKSKSITVYDVPKSNITPLTSGLLYAMKSTYKLESGIIKLDGLTPKPAQELNAWAKNPNVQPTETMMLSHTYDSPEDAKAAAEGGIPTVKAHIYAKVEEAVGYKGSINYSYGETAIL